jgi:hypothetical protein
MHGQSRIADASQLEFRIIHRNSMTGRFGCGSRMAAELGGQATTALMER